jgi:hypothetical protein
VRSIRSEEESSNAINKTPRFNKLVLFAVILSLYRLNYLLQYNFALKEKSWPFLHVNCQNRTLRQPPRKFICIRLHVVVEGPVAQSVERLSYGAGRSGDRILVGVRFSAPVQTGPGAHPASCTMDTGAFPRVKCGRGVLLTPHPLLVPRPWKNRAIPLPTLWATPGL